MDYIVKAVKKALKRGIPIYADGQPYNIKLEKDGLWLETQLGTMKWLIVSLIKKKK
jgi:hypothetical protein